MSMLLGLLGDLHMSADDADLLLTKAADAREVTFYIEPALTKWAGTIQRMAEPEFHQFNDSNFNVPVDVPQRYAVPTRTENDPGRSTVSVTLGTGHGSR